VGQLYLVRRGDGNLDKFVSSLQLCAVLLISE
jgi:hypothetical protein